ncbi:MAG: oligosaccharide flippase family protein [Bacteroidales bacterium]|nr:oligosaccharide flippase family protein [Bacteroidales bacterium]
MNPIKQLAGQTAVYGLGIVVPRLLNYLLLTPFYTRIFDKAEYGIYTEFYAYVVILMVLLTYGMETGFFRFADKEHNQKNVYRSALFALGSSSLFFIFFTLVFSRPIATGLGYQAHPEYVWWVGMIVGLDSFASIPFAKLRLENKALKYAVIRILEVVVNIGANWFFLFYCPKHEHQTWVAALYNPQIGVGYVFLANLLSVIVKVIALSKEIFFASGMFDFPLMKKMLTYSFPLLIAGLAGTVNEVIDRVLLKYLIPAAQKPMEQLGIYGASVKLAVLMTLFIQMFRYAAEPFFFSKKDDTNAREIYAMVMKYFVFFGMAIFLFVMLFMDIFILFIGPDFREGASIIPVVLMANLFMGVFYNLSIWYKLSNKTIWGAYLVIIGAAVTFLINYFFIPKYGYYASSWGRFISYLLMVIVSFSVGQQFYKINYQLKQILILVVLAILLYLSADLFTIKNLPLRYTFNAGLLAFYFLFFYLMEKRKLIRKHAD